MGETVEVGVGMDVEVVVGEAVTVEVGVGVEVEVGVEVGVAVGVGVSVDVVCDVAVGVGVCVDVLLAVVADTCEVPLARLICVASPVSVTVTSGAKLESVSNKQIPRINDGRPR